MATGGIKGTLLILTGVLGLHASASVMGAPRHSVEPRGLNAMLDVQPPILPLMADVGGPPAAGTITITNAASSAALVPTCSLGAVSGDPGVMISVPPFSGTIAAGGTASVSASCSGTAAGFANSAYTCVDVTALVVNDTTIIDCTVTTSPAQLAISGVTDPVRPGPGDPVDFVIRVQNTMGVDDGNFTVAVSNYPGINMTPIIDSNWSCFFGKGSPINCDHIGPPLPVGGTVELRLPTTAPLGGVAFSSDAFLSSSGSVLPPNPITITSGTASSLSLNVVPPPDPSPVGGNVSYMVTVTNQDRGIPEDGAPARNVGMASFFESMMSGAEVFLSGVGSNWSCQDIDNGDSTAVNCSYGPDIPVGMTSAPLTLTFSAPAPFPPALNSSFDPRADNYTPLPSDNVQVITGIVPSIDLSIAKSASVATANVNDQFKYTLTATNNGPSDAFGGDFTVTDTLPPEVSFMAANGTDFNCMEAGGTVTCDYVGSVATSGSSVQVEIDVTAAAGGRAMNNATVSANGPAIDPNPGNDSAGANVTINPLVDLTVSKTATLSTPAKGLKSFKGPSVLVGDNLDYELMVSNLGPDAAPAFTVSDPLPPEVSFVGAFGQDFSCNQASGVVNCTFTAPPLTPAGTTFINIEVTANLAGTATNSASVAAGGGAVDSNPANDTSNSVNTTIGAAADLALMKTASANNITTGAPLTYTLDISNNGPSTATMFSVSDTLPGLMSYTGFMAAAFACSETSGVVTCNYTGPGLAAGQTTRIDINVTATADGSTNNTASVSADATALDTDPTNNSDSAMVVVGPAADLRIDKNASVATAVIGDPISYTLNVTNDGPSNVSNFTVQDNLPGQVNFVGANANDFICNESAGLVTCNYASTFLGAGLTSSITIDVMAAANGMANNTATVFEDAFAPDPNPGNNSDAAVVAIGAVADLRIAKSASVANALVGDTLDFGLVVSNDGPQLADAFTVTDPLPPQLAFDSFTAVDFNCNANGQVVACAYNGSGLAAGQTSSITLTVRATSTGNANNTATVSADATAMDPNNGNNTASRAVAIGTPGVDLAIDKSAVATSQVGLIFSYLIRVSNVGNQDASGVRVSDVLPPGIGFRGTVGSDWACQESDGTLDCGYTPGVLAPGQTSLFRISVDAAEPGTVVNTASVSQLQSDSDPSNNSDSATVLIMAAQGQAADLSLSKTSLPDSVLVGEVFQYRLQVSNAGPDAATQVVINDTLPAGVQFVSAAGAGWTCTVIGGDLQCQLADPLASGAAAGVTLTVIAPAESGSILNQAGVSAAQSDPNPDDNQASAATTVVEMEMTPSADVAVVKLVDRSSAVQGNLLSYSITVSNSGPISASGVTLSDVIPQGLDLQDVSTPGWSCAVTTADIACDLLQDLGVGQTATIELTGQVLTSSGNIVNQVVVASGTDDPNPGNNTSQASTVVTGFGAPADLAVNIDDSVDPVLTGEPVDYFLTLRNDGLGQASGIQLQGTLPAGVTVISLTAPDSYDCQIDGLHLLCQSPNLLIGGVEHLFTLSLLAPGDPGTIAFSAEASILGLGIDDNPGNNFASEETQVRTTPTAEQLQQALLDALGDLDDPVVTENLLPVAVLCGDPLPQLLELCRAIADALADGREGEVAEAIRQLVGRQTLTQHTALVEANANQFRNVDARQAFNRGGGGGGQVSLSGLNFRYGNEHLPLSFLQAADDESEPRIDSQGLIKPWGFFINGTISGGEKDPTTREIEFEFDTYGVTAGVDYRFSTRFIGGAAIGYADFDSDSPDGTTLRTDGFTYHVFASYYPRDSFYLDGRVSYGRINLDQRRPIKFAIGAFSVDDIASAETDSDQFSGAFSFGLLMNRGGWSFTPRASVSFMDADIDGFAETGADFSLIYDKQNIESLVFSAGISASKVFSLSRGVLTPQFDFSFEHESQNDDNAFNSQIIGAASGSAFFIDADEPDRNYANAGLGLVFVAANGRQAFLSYRKILGLGGFSRWTVNAGFRMEF